MKKSERLFFLIKSLSQAEKRHFVLQGESYKSNADYMNLYKFIDSMDVYDESSIKTHFRGKKFLKQFHVIKSYLMNMILKSLRSFHSDHSRDAEVKELLQNVEILFNKELYSFGETELRKAKKLAYQFELFHSIMEILSWERRLEQAKNPHNYLVFEGLLEEENYYLQIIENQHSYNKLILAITEGITNGKLDDIADVDLLDNDQNPKSFEAIVMHCNAKYFLAVVNKEPDKAETLLYQIIDYLETMPDMINAYPGYYASSINNFISFLVFNKQEGKAIELIQKAKSFYEQLRIIGENRNLMKQILRSYNLELEIYRNNEQTMDLEHFKSMEVFVQKNAAKMPKSYLVSFWFQFSLIWFNLKNYKESLKWVNEILNYRHAIKESLETVKLARILNLIIHYELGNEFVLRYYVDNTKRVFKKYGLENSRNKTLLKLFSKLGKTPSMDHPELFKKYIALFQDEKEASEPELFFFDYMNWLQSKV